MSEVALMASAGLVRRYTDVTSGYFVVLLALSSVIALGVCAFIVFYAIRYHHTRPADRSGAVTDSTLVELTWIVVPLVLASGVFVWAALRYVEIREAPPGEALEIYAVGKQWMWKFKHPNGPREINALHVPMGRTVRLTMTSQDVIHSFYVPAFRVKQDVLPNHYTRLWFRATRPGRYRLFCTEYCGTSHSAMLAKLHVLPEADYEKFLKEGGGPPEGVTPEEWGEQLFTQNACNTCHSTDGSPKPGPTFQGLFGRFGYYKILAARQVVGRYALSPPELPGDTPVADILHPAEELVLPPLGMKLHIAVTHRLHGLFGQRLHTYEPLARDQRLYNLV